MAEIQSDGISEVLASTCSDNPVYIVLLISSEVEATHINQHFSCCLYGTGFYRMNVSINVLQRGGGGVIKTTL